MALLPETELEQLARDHFTFEVLALIDALGKGAAGPAPHGRFLSEGLPWHALGTHDLLLHTRLGA